jgi:hypothetical protein
MAGEITLEEMAKKIRSLQQEILCDWDDDGEPPIVQEQVNQVLNALSSAASHARIADLWKVESELVVRRR